ncbi:MAG: MFS transporter, partial [Candidatus Omnitrophica bacterium]|nr:MFS transporter [Candidatus Omnitrophota bacterium]
LTNSAFLLGLVGFLGSMPIFLLSLFGGVVADRINKKKILIFTQIAFMLLAFALGVLTQLKLITPFQIMLIAALNGIIMAFDAPARQAIVVELTGRVHLLNAIALNSAAFNSARIIGPALAGVLISMLGMSGCFYLNGVSFLALLISLWMIETNSFINKNNQSHLVKDLFAGLEFMRKNRVILILISMVGVTSVFGISYVILIPVVAKEVLKIGVKGFGMLMSSTGIGALLAALLLARLGDFKAKGKLLIVSAIVFSFSLVFFSLSKVYLISLIALVFIGGSSVLAMALVNTLLQINVADEFRGRVISAFMFTFSGLMPFGNLFAGVLSEVLGVSLTLMIGGIICAVFFIAINIFCPEIKRI